MEAERKRNRNREKDNEDRISQLPEFIIHQILSYLHPKEAARTSVLSKTWLQSYSTSPILTFNEPFFVRSAEIVEKRYLFFNFVNNTLLRYTRLNLRIHKLEITVFRVDHEPAYSLLDESLGVAFHNGVQELHITVLEALHFFPPPYTLPSPMFDTPKLLTYLRVDNCKFPENIVSNSKCNAISFPFLKTLNLCSSYINNDMLQNLLSGSPSLEKIVLFNVFGFTKIRVTNLGELKILDINCWRAFVIDVEDAPRLCLLKCWGSFENERPCLLKVGSSLQSLNLKRLELRSVSINDNSLNDVIAKSSLLEDLLIGSCDELERVYILSSSLKHLDFKRCKMLVEARIDAPNLLELNYIGQIMFSLSLENSSRLKTFIYYAEFVKFLSTELMTTARNPNCCSSDQTKCWRHYLEDIKIEVYKNCQEEWQPLIRETSLSEFKFSGEIIHFSLKWFANLNAEV